jgi:hypothetical protein
MAERCTIVQIAFGTFPLSASRQGSTHNRKDLTMQGATIVLGMIVAVTVLILFTSAGRMRMQGPRGPQGQFGPNQGAGQWGQQPGYNPGPQQSGYGQGPQQRQGITGSGGAGRGGGLLQFFAIVGVLVILGACGLMVLALQRGIQ